MRAVEPVQSGVVAAPDGVRIAYEVFGAGNPDARIPPFDADRPFAPVEGPGSFL